MNAIREADGEFFAPEHQQPQDWGKLAGWLAERGHAFAPDPPPRQFAGGFGNLNFLIEMDGTACVLRRPPLGPLPPGANDMGREYKVLSGLWRAFPLAPKAHVFCDDPAVLGAPFFIMEYRPGLVVRDVLPPALAGKGVALSAMLIDVLADFQRVDPEAVGLDGLGHPEGFLGRAVAGWVKRFHVAAQDVYADKPVPAAADELIGWLLAQPIPEGRTTLLHNDYKLNNIILKPEAPIEPLALLDWDMCTRGDPLFDFATLLSYWAEPERSAGNPRSRPDALDPGPVAGPAGNSGSLRQGDRHRRLRHPFPPGADRLQAGRRLPADLRPLLPRHHRRPAHRRPRPDRRRPVRLRR